jgi:hypothetical protein
MSSVPTQRFTLVDNSRKKARHASPTRGLAVGNRVRRATAGRSPAWATKRGAAGDRRSTFHAAWESRKPCHTLWAERRGLPPRQAGGFDGWHFRDRRTRPHPPVAANYRPARDVLPAPRRPDGLSDRGAEQLFRAEGACVVAAAQGFGHSEPPLTIYSRPVRSCRRHDGTPIYNYSRVDRCDRRDAMTCANAHPVCFSDLWGDHMPDRWVGCGSLHAFRLLFSMPLGQSPVCSPSQSYL